MKYIKLIIGAIALIYSTTASPIEGACGKENGNASCSNGNCCSKFGWCGKLPEHCYISYRCQSEFGECINDTTSRITSSTRKTTSTTRTSTTTKKTTTTTTTTRKPTTTTTTTTTTKKSTTTTKKSTTTTKKSTTTTKKTTSSTTRTTTTTRSTSSSIVKSGNSNYKAITSSSSSSGNVEWAGFRYSPYGVKKSFGYMPSAKNWEGYIDKIKNNFYINTQGAVVLIVGVESKTKYCEFGFPEPKYVSSSLNVKFSDTDEYEDFLKKCDEKGYKVWLQVEAGDNDLVKLADIVFDRYGHHPSVKGFGIDCEWWYRNYTSENHGRPLSDSEAKRVVDAVRKRNSSYTVFAKHWKTSFMPQTYRDGMIFVNDSQGFHGSLERMKKEFKEWAKTYPNNPVIFQIGYNADTSIWKDDPIKVAKAIVDNSSDFNKHIGVVWVDFTMKDALDKM